MERIKIDQSEACNFAIAAIVQGKDEGLAVPNTRGCVDVQLLINGVEVPFTKTIEDIYRRFHANVNYKAAELAMEKVELKGLGELDDLIQHSRHLLQEKIEDVFGVKLDEY